MQIVIIMKFLAGLLFVQDLDVIRTLCGHPSRLTKRDRRAFPSPYSSPPA